MYNLIVFGCYALAKIGLGLIAFKDCSEDAALLDEVSTYLVDSLDASTTPMSSMCFLCIVRLVC